MEENKNDFGIVRILSKIKEKGYIEVKDMVLFTNGIYEINTVKEETINKMLEDKEYQVSEKNVTIDTPIIQGYIAPTEYIPTIKATGLYEVKQLRTGEEPVLIWKADVLLDILGIKGNYYIDFIASNLLLNSGIYKFYDSHEEPITYSKTLKRNLQYLESLGLIENLR